MTPLRRRIVITFLVIGVALGLVAAVMFSSGPASGKAASTGSAPAATSGAPSTGQPAPAGGTRDGSEKDQGAGTAAGTTTASQTASPAPPNPTLPPLAGLRAVAPPGPGFTGSEIPPQPLGALDPRQFKMRLEFSRAGAGIRSLVFSDFWLTADARRRAEAHYRALVDGETPPPLPDDSLRYVLISEQEFHDDFTGRPWRIMIPALATSTVQVNGQSVPIFESTAGADGVKSPVWSETAPGQFATQIIDGEGRAILKITRTFTLAPDSYDVTIRQRLTNLTDQPLQVTWEQYGPGEMPVDIGGTMDRRRFHFGYLWSSVSGPSASIVHADDSDLLLDRSALLKDHVLDKSDPPALWPTSTSKSKGYILSWFAGVNRYFALTVHPILDDPVNGRRSFTDIVERIERTRSFEAGKPTGAFTNLFSPMRTIAPGETASLDMGVYAGPMDGRILAGEEPYRALGMDGLILFLMSASCSFCTFQWLARALLWFLSAVHAVTFDWGIAIIMLVCLVRLVLHPLTKKSQVNLQRFGRAMQAMKPEIEKLQKKYPNDPKKVQAEQMRLMREHGANPLQMLGCVPMFLQMPIWLALYAMLYFAFDLRQQPGFWGVFQLFGGWSFLADLSSPDNFIILPGAGFVIPVVKWTVSSINLLPLLMGVVFFVQQKYMAPPPSATMTPEQVQQQKIMKVMMVVLFPVMMYNVPSGLTMYICTSSLIGIIESRYIRKHMEGLELNPAAKNTPRPKVKPKDAQGRAFAEAIERAKARRLPPPKTFKKRER